MKAEKLTQNLNPKPKETANCETQPQILEAQPCISEAQLRNSGTQPRSSEAQGAGALSGAPL